jgi:hypothetical protein
VLKGSRLSLVGCRGFSVTEVTTILTAMTILSGAAAPAVNDYVEQAKLVRARHDVRTIAVSLVRMFSDVGAERSLEGGWSSYKLLVGDGMAPASGVRESDAWTAATAAAGVGLLNDQLITNETGYTRGHLGVQLGWRGAYLQDAVAADPWGHRYGVNVGAMQTKYDDTVVLSAGPDGVVDSPFQSDGLPTAGDDIVSVVSAAGLGR